jgi:hypothetical protein
MARVDFSCDAIRFETLVHVATDGQALSGSSRYIGEIEDVMTEELRNDNC